MNYTYKIITNAVSSEYCDYISNQVAVKFPEHGATIGEVEEKEKNNSDGRKSRIRWISPREDTRELFRCFEYMMQDINRKNFGFDISFGVENFQYTEYWGSEKGHYTWHMDTHHGTYFSDRKLSMSLQLSDPSEYEGGIFCIEKYATPQPFDMAALAPKGSMIIFPSYISHCVTPVTSGVRKSLVGWWNGPAYK
jgi:PKHD-type hydroxylase